MATRYLFLLILLLFVSDLLIINSSFTIAYFVLDVRYQSSVKSIGFYFFAIFNFCWLISAFIIKLYAKTTAQSIETVYAKTWRTIVLHILFCSVFLLITQGFFFKNFLISIFIFETVGFFASRFVVTAFDQYNLRMTRYKKNIMILGYNETAIKLANYFTQNKMSYNFAGFVNYDDHELPQHLKKSNCSIPAFPDFVAEHDIREVYSTVFPDSDNVQLKTIIDVAEQNCVRVKFVADEKQTIDSNLYLENYIDNMPVINFRTEPLEIFKNQFIKRVLDVCFSSCIILFLCTWLIPIIAILIKINSKGPVFFFQKRAGKDNKPFKIFKFRTMNVTEQDNEYRQAKKNDSRVTKVGAFLRKTSLDEIPQFLNVLIGNMSIVGPRPHPLKLNDEYMMIVDKYMVRHYSKPGITGWAQVNGYRGETYKHSQMIKRVEHDIYYIENWSVMLDLKIILLTAINMIRGEENAI